MNLSSLTGLPTLPEAEAAGEKLEDKLLAGLRQILKDYQIKITFEEKEPSK